MQLAQLLHAHHVPLHTPVSQSGNGATRGEAGPSTSVWAIKITAFRYAQRPGQLTLVSVKLIIDTRTHAHTCTHTHTRTHPSVRPLQSVYSSIHQCIQLTNIHSPMTCQELGGISRQEVRPDFHPWDRVRGVGEGCRVARTALRHVWSFSKCW